MNLLRAALQLRNASIIWLFHDISDSDWFERCVDEICATRDVVPLVELADGRRHENACAITFDDGLRSVVEVAHPILAARRLPYTVFLCTEVLTAGIVPWFFRVAHLARILGVEPVRSRWNVLGDRPRTVQELIIALKQVPLDSILEGLEHVEAQHAISLPDPQSLFLSAEEVRTIAQTGATIGSHTHRHPILSLLSVQEQTFELEESANEIRSITGRYPVEFSYPNGTPLDFDASTMDLLRASGFRVAVTTTPGHLRATDDLMALPRIGLSDGDSTARRLVKTLAPSLSLTHRRERSLRLGSGAGRMPTRRGLRKPNPARGSR